MPPSIRNIIENVIGSRDVKDIPRIPDAPFTVRTAYLHRKDKNHDSPYRDLQRRMRLIAYRLRHSHNRISGLNWKGRPIADEPDGRNVAGQIMFLPSEPRLQAQRALCSDAKTKFMDPEGYRHPVLILTNPDSEGFVIVQKASLIPPFMRI